MSDCNPHIETHRTKGLTQLSRSPKALDSEFIKIDERAIEDLIVSAYRLSTHLHFYDGENVILGNWSSFFGWESTSILAQIASLDIQKFAANYKTNKQKLILLPSDDHRKIIDPYFQSINILFKDLFQKVSQLPLDLSIKDYFNSTKSTLSVLLEAIMLQVNQPDDLNILFQNHLFNKKIQNLFGLLTDWKQRSREQLHKNLESYPKHSPQYALYIAFLKLFENAQTDLNTFTKRHLDFYYKDVLHLSPQKASPDYVHCYIEPHLGTSTFSIEKDSVFLAGKAKDGKKKYYASTADATINKAVIETIYGGFKNNSRYYFNDLTETNAQGESWKAFTKDAIADQLGFAMASPLFFLKGGDRVIQINFSKHNGETLELNVNDYNFYISAEEEWFQIKNPTNIEGQLHLSLANEDPSIIPLNSEVHDGISINTPFPVLKIIAKNGKLSSFRCNKILIKVVVSNYRQFKLFSDTGTIDHTKSFEPFGLIPKNGHSITFSNKEFFQKKKAKGNLNIETSDNSWNIYQNTKLEYLENGIWTAENNWNRNDQLFRLHNRGPIDFDFTDDEKLTPSDANGFFKIILNKGYAGETYLNTFIKQSKLSSPVLPYIPTISDVTFAYEADSQHNHVSFFNMYPKGYEKLSGTNFTIVPKIDNDGELFIGIKDIDAGNSLSLLFQVAEGSANPRQLPIELRWTYLEGNRWVPFSAESIGDETNGLTQSGIVHLQAPEDLDHQTQTKFPKGIWWIKVEVAERVDAICHLVGIHTQALKAVLFDHDENGLEFQENLAPETISKLLKPKNEIKKVNQPYSSFYGRLRDTDSMFYKRSSERLRHKERAISIWDYETLVLDNFPEVFRVKCLNHYRYDAHEIDNSSSGYVTIIPIAKGLGVNVPVYWKPIVPIGTMKRIKTFLESKSSHHTRINVKPPKLEQLEVVFNFKHHDVPGADSRLYTQRLIETINTFLSPWAYNKDSSVEFQTEIEKSKLIQLIEMQSFVDYISDFKVNHHILDDTTSVVLQSFNDVEKIVPKTVYSLFVPHEHSITTINNVCCS
ncbi:hypothetical protein [uncultured Psychroserpens sp.]|uniref:hypothetical protein n=1 Tax=uncultured Psychroserpens sp. TaxID=255436 RepID=UPI00263990F6|nr:hypothetical protein [uncultured Psychroserpens sp.]